MNRIWLIIIFGIIPAKGVLLAQYAPPAGQPGTTAMHKDSSAFVAWGGEAEIVRGLQDISDSTLGYATVGNEESPLGPSNGQVISLGDGGYATLNFAGYIYNGPGPDFAVFENAFSDTFLELAFVEVSSDGLNFFRFPCVSLTDTSVQMDNNAAMDATKIYNLAGKYRAQYGVPFDLEELQGIPGLSTDSITHVRIIDVVGSLNDAYATYDSSGNKINDPWTTPFPSSGFDLDAIGVMHCSGCATGSIAIKNISRFRMYPNPVKHNGTIRVQLSKGELMAQVFIASMNGQQKGHYSVYSDYPFISLQGLVPGIYYMSIQGDKIYETGKLVITH